MDSIVLSPKELLVLSSKMGAKSFFGIQDPFRGMTGNEIRAALPEIQIQLEKKGLATLRFDDSFMLTSLCEEIISTCALCDRYIEVDSIISGKIQPKSLFYFRNGECVSIHESEIGLELKKVAGNDVVDLLISSAFSDCPDAAEEIAAVKFPQSLLAEVRDMEFQDALDALNENGCPSAIAEVLLSGLHQKCEYCSLIAVDLKKHDVRNIICVITKDKCLRLSSDEEDDVRQAAWISKEDIHSEIESIIKSYGIC